MNSAVANEQLNQSVSELRGVLAERQGALAVTLEGARAQRAGALNAQLSEKQSLLENAGLLTYTQELLKETDQPCFVQAARITHNRLGSFVGVFSWHCGCVQLALCVCEACLCTECLSHDSLLCVSIDTPAIRQTKQVLEY